MKQNLDEETSLLCPIKAAREKVEDEQGSRLANEDTEDGLQDHKSTQEASIFMVVDSRTHGCRFSFRLCSP